MLAPSFTRSASRLLSSSKVKILDLVKTNTGYTLVKTLNNVYNLFTANKNDSVLVNYGDGNQKTLQLTSSKY